MEGPIGVVTIRKLNQNVPSVVARAQAGEVVRVTRNGEVVAEVHPPSAPFRRDRLEWKAAYARLAESLERGGSIGRTFSHGERND